MTSFLFCLAELTLEVYYKLLQLFDSFNIFSADNVKITELSIRDDGVFFFWTGFMMRMDHHSCMSLHLVASNFFLVTHLMACFFMQLK